MNQKLSTILSHSEKNHQSVRQSPQQLELFAAPNTGLVLKTKPQIVSIPGISLKELHRYRVTLGSRILGDRLTLDEALKLAKRGEA